jgi:xanthine dehydrogenase YagR molybdenum-binding subunit
VTGVFDLEAAKNAAKKPKGEDKPDAKVGDFDAGFAAAPVKLDATYTTPDQSHAMMEPHASIAAWERRQAHGLYTSNQMINWGKKDLAKTLGIPKENVRLVSPFIGGGFGGKLFLRSEALMAALGAKAAGTPGQGDAAARADDQQHDAPPGDHPAHPHRRHARRPHHGDRPRKLVRRPAGGQPETAVGSRPACCTRAPNRMTAMRLATLDLPEGNAMRAPGEAPGLMALEIAMDELAEKLKMDPVTLRIVNDTTVDPEKPAASSRSAAWSNACAQGAERFGWDKRKAQPGQVREGRWLVGMGMARPSATISTCRRRRACAWSATAA